MPWDLNLLKNTTLLKALPEKEILGNLKNGGFRVVSFGKNSIIHFDGETCSKLEIILSGRVVVERIDEDGNLFTISRFHSDDILGGNLLFSKSPYYPMTVSTQLPTDLLEINKEALFVLLSRYPRFLRTYLELISGNAFVLGSKIKHYANKTIRESIISFLNFESKKQNSKHIKLNITKKALARKIGVQRTSLSRELAKMRDDGLIIFDRDSITVLK
ncbi:MAG: Crp/Fnr family transcriptional regulator [Firmicutes bacterium]|nr:Crp/Fnr family transcriptional regulator [Bacillota bacterium]